MKKIAATLGFIGICSLPFAQQHPCLYVTNNDREAVIQKIKTEPWAAAAWKNLQKDIDKYVDRHITDSTWILSRLAMYWKEGEHYTQCYIKNENWDYGEGNAPVPTVRLPGMRIWNDYVNVPLEDRIPYSVNGDMKATSKKDPAAPPVIVPYKNTGHLVRGNNVEILTLAEKAAFAYWITRKEKYAKFAADIFNTWLVGTYYMQPPYDPSKMKSAYDPGVIYGYYDYEQIHDDLATHAAPTYDFLFDYLQQHPAAHVQSIHKTTQEVAAVVFKRFADIGMVRGGNKGNWNVNGWDMMMRPILVLESNDHYTDQKGKEYYLHYFTTESTKWHDALPDILKSYDPVTGLWPESPGYAFGTINCLLDMAMPIYKQGTDIIGSNPVMQKAAMAVFPWMDQRGHMVVFGDGRGGSADYNAFERLLTYYTLKKDTTDAALVSAALQKAIASGQYSRDKSEWSDICINQPLTPSKGQLPYARTAWSAEHRHLIMKNGGEEKNGLMFTLYGGTNGKHLSPNGLALQLYGFGWALAPDAAAYESYWSADKSYHQTATGSNTIIPGYTEGPVTMKAMEPALAPDSFTTASCINPSCSFADMLAGDKRRMVSMIRTSSTTGYYIDIFSSGLSNNDYLWHNLGNTLTITDSLHQLLPLTKVTDLGTAYNKAYSYFTNQQKTLYDGDILANWSVTTTTPAIHMAMWMQGSNGRALYAVDAPPTTLVGSVVPGKAGLSPNTTPTLIVRQNNNNAPFVAVFEPYKGNQPAVKKVTVLPSDSHLHIVQVESNDLSEALTGRKETILYTTDEKLYKLAANVQFNGSFAIISENQKGLQYLYMGKGRLLRKDSYAIEADSTVAASLINTDGKLSYSATGSVTITLPYAGDNRKASLFYRRGLMMVEAKTTVDIVSRTISAIVPAGYASAITIITH